MENLQKLILVVAVGYSGSAVAADVLIQNAEDDTNQPTVQRRRSDHAAPQTDLEPAAKTVKRS